MDGWEDEKKRKREKGKKGRSETERKLEGAASNREEHASNREEHVEKVDTRGEVGAPPSAGPIASVMLTRSSRPEYTESDDALIPFATSIA